jgi:hypothetical protein
MSGMSRNCRESLDHYHCAPVRSCLKERRRFYMQRMMTWEDLVEPIYQDVIEITKVGRWSEIRIVP